MQEPKFKIGDPVIWDGDQGVIVEIKISDERAPYPFWYIVDIGYTDVGAYEKDLDKPI